MNHEQLLNLYDPMSATLEFERFKDIMERFETLTEMLAQQQVRKQTNYTGKDLNLLESISDKVCDSTIELKDVYELEKLVFRFM